MGIGMRERRYLLDIRQMLEGDGREAVLQKAFARIDRERRRKALPLKNARAQAASVGAGLLIQRALGEARSARVQVFGADSGLPIQRNLGEDGSARVALQRYSVEELLQKLDASVIEPCYQYGNNGKPYLKANPFFFNISHSGDYVFCGVSGQEIGVDIQKLQGKNELRLARRFFSSAEYQALEARGDVEERRQMFFRMWTRKEAYGKLMGEGLSGSMGKDLWTGEAPRKANLAGYMEAAEKQRSETVQFLSFGPEGRELLWEEYEEPPGYRIAVCRFGTGRIQGSRWPDDQQYHD